ncbi:Na(+)/H(+) exchange regulatory cofactor NHE-RF1 [Drosophila eugracilis]|uniref:Na(+)/H(+) exchange regulatory cofactor NHE-RF1 n=1 Tax=Drosophila eugracilis TaxID=29029 RepID=UPI0007E76194|nr:Na(+)/H(+) exchange regulatory cofactor NHE-RF1 [Drosophila eugracilis]XP_017078866.1 Na(+)/H(+) exchange regulatory cofactor NHE-RF1 [Drosophila eugracilis]XP_017078867.1 Na(+)/H(+) exchange regulatory cofactor NHE-RF1 [Drosophila eugracilis]
MSTPTFPKTPTPPTLPPGVTKTCHIVKRPDFDGYGFNLHSEKVKPGQFIGKVDADSPAEAAGLKEGDRILEVNGVSIGSETHKQVVARIKAIANEVRLLLIDVDGKAIEVKPVTPPTAATVACNGNGSASQNGYEGTKQEMPGASANISSISMVSTKRSSNASSIQSGSTMNASDLDVVDRGIPAVPVAVPAPVVTPPPPVQNGSKPSSPINNNTLISTPPPPSATKAGINNNGSVYNTNGNGTNGMTTPITPPPASGVNRAGSLNLPLTVAEMRAKLASKKKYDPKNESVDLKKKFDIIQKL